MIGDTLPGCLIFVQSFNSSSVIVRAYLYLYKWYYVYIYASPILVHIERSVILQEQKKIRKNLQLEKVKFLILVEWG